jgi:hypothetical protein
MELAASSQSHKKSKWVNKYRDLRSQWQEDMEDQREQDAHMFERMAIERLEHTRSAMLAANRLPKIQQSRSKILPRERWQPSWGRCDYCERTGEPAPPGMRVECLYCPVVVRVDALTQAEINEIGRFWLCGDCREDIRENKVEEDGALAKAEDERKLHMYAQSVQAHLRAYGHRREFARMRAATTLFASAMRGRWSRKEMRANMIGKRKVFRINVISARGLRSADTNGLSDPVVIVSLFDREQRKQLFRFDTSVESETLAPEWRESFLGASPPRSPSLSPSCSPSRSPSLALFVCVTFFARACALVASPYPGPASPALARPLPRPPVPQCRAATAS